MRVGQKVEVMGGGREGHHFIRTSRHSVVIVGTLICMFRRKAPIIQLRPLFKLWLFTIINLSIANISLVVRGLVCKLYGAGSQGGVPLTCLSAGGRGEEEGGGGSESVVENG